MTAPPSLSSPPIVHAGDGAVHLTFPLTEEGMAPLMAALFVRAAPTIIARFGKRTTCCVNVVSGLQGGGKLCVHCALHLLSEFRRTFQPISSALCRFTIPAGGRVTVVGAAQLVTIIRPCTTQLPV